MAARKKNSPTGVEPESVLPSNRSRAAFPVVGIGASAGGLAALTSFLKNLPRATGIAFILAQHRSPIAKDDILIPLLKTHALIDVVEIRDGMPLSPDRLHVPPPGNLMGVFNGKLQLFKEEPGQRERLPIDFFFRSLGEDLKEQAGVVVLSGADTDGTLGVKAVKGLGGLVVVQDPESAEFNVMPASAANTGMADFILAPQDMPETIIKYMRRAATATTHIPNRTEDLPQGGLEKILFILRSGTGNDFTFYKHKTILRRIKRRMDLQQIDRLADYAIYLKQNPAGVQDLFKDLLIGVTNFFRDPDAFQAMKLELVAALKAQPRTKKVLRFWVPGCSSGEEAYSLAMIAKEAILETEREFTVQIYATDLDSQTIDAARQGLYPLNIASDVPPDRLERFFSKSETGYKIRSEIREMIVFSVQNILQDPPFSRLDAICCRNLLIYLNPIAQKRVLALFHYALQDNGILFLGTSESVGSPGDMFQEKDKKWRIYLRRPSPTPPNPVYPDEPFPHRPCRGCGTRPRPGRRRPGIRRPQDHRRTLHPGQLRPGLAAGHPDRRDPAHPRQDREIPGAAPGQARHQHLRHGPGRPQGGPVLGHRPGRGHHQEGHRPASHGREDERRHAACPALRELRAQHAHGTESAPGFLHGRGHAQEKE